MGGINNSCASAHQAQLACDLGIFSTIFLKFSLQTTGTDKNSGLERCMNALSPCKSMLTNYWIFGSIVTFTVLSKQCK